MTIKIGSPFVAQDIIDYAANLTEPTALSIKEAEDFMSRYGSNICDIMTERGWEAIDTLFMMWIADRKKGI